MAASKKLYDQLAASFANEMLFADEAEQRIVERVMRTIASDLKHDNAGFDRTRFFDTVERLTNEAMARRAARAE